MAFCRWWIPCRRLCRRPCPRRRRSWARFPSTMLCSMRTLALKSSAMTTVRRLLLIRCASLCHPRQIWRPILSNILWLSSHFLVFSMLRQTVSLFCVEGWTTLLQTWLVCLNQCPVPRKTLMGGIFMQPSLSLSSESLHFLILV